MDCKMNTQKSYSILFTKLQKKDINFKKYISIKKKIKHQFCNFLRYPNIHDF